MKLYENCKHIFGIHFFTNVFSWKHLVGKICEE